MTFFQTVIEDESNAFIISKLFDLTTEETEEQDSNPVPSSALWSCSLAMYLLHLRPRTKTVK